MLQYVCYYDNVIKNNAFSGSRKEYILKGYSGLKIQSGHNHGIFEKTYSLIEKQ